MILMKKESTYKVKIPTNIAVTLAVFISVVIAGSVFESTRLRTDGPVLKVASRTKIVTNLETDSLFTSVNAGDSVRMLGYRKDGVWLNYLVETPDGVRGWIRPWNVKVPVLTYHDSIYAGDSIMLMPPKTYYYRGQEYVDKEIFGRLPDGAKTTNLFKLDYLPAVDRWTKFSLRDDNPSHFASKERFERQTVGYPLADVDRRYGPVMQIARKSDGSLEAVVNTSVFDKESGKFFTPALTMGPDSLVTGVRLGHPTDRNAWVWRYLPFASAMIDFPLTSFAARSDLYGIFRPVNTYDSTFGKWVNVALRILYVLCSMMWFFCITAIPPLIIVLLLYTRSVLNPLSDTFVKIIAVLLAALFAYYWMIVVMAWGAYFLWAVLIVPATFFWYNMYVANLLDDSAPHLRCQECRAMESMEFLSRDFQNTEVVMENNTRSHITGRRTKKWQTWTQVTQGSSSWRENVKDHYETTTNWRDDHYLEKVKYDRYIITYECSCCGNKEYVRDADRDVLDSKYQGSSTYTTQSSSD